jgi:hypothetical protein
MTGYGAPQPQQRSGQQLPLFDLIGAGLGILSFVWGFLDWYGSGGGGQTIKGYGALSGASGAIGLSLLASAVAATVLLDREAKPTLVPLAASAASLLVTFGLLVGKGTGVDTKIGVILMLITALAQVALFVVGWLQSQGKIMNGTPASSGQWGGSGQYGGYPAAQPQYGQQPAQPQYTQPAQHQAPAQPQYGQPVQPQYGQPAQHQAPAQPQAPQQPQYGQQPPGNPYGQG